MSQRGLFDRAPPVCIGGDPSCPCQDGDLCHYRDSPDGTTKALPLPSKPLRFCNACQFLQGPANEQYLALGLFRCARGVPYSHFSTVRDDGAPRECERGLYADE